MSYRLERKSRPERMSTLPVSGPSRLASERSCPLEHEGAVVTAASFIKRTPPATPRGTILFIYDSQYGRLLVEFPTNALGRSLACASESNSLPYLATVT